MARMAANMLVVVFGVLLMAAQMKPILASDPDLTTDYAINATSGADFTFTGLRNPPPAPAGTATVAFASFVQFPALTGFGLTALLFEFAPQSQVSPHTHQRATELFYVLSGTIEVGFIDTANTLFTSVLQAGDLFIFPKGLLHYQRNYEGSPASGYSVFNSQNPGLQFASSLFTGGGTGFPDIVLSTAFVTTTDIIDDIKKGLAA